MTPNLKLYIEDRHKERLSGAFATLHASLHKELVINESKMQSKSA